MSYKIGLLLPQSNIYASSKDFVWGFRQGLKQVEDFPIELFIENMGYAKQNTLQQQYDKLALQNQPNIIVGVSQWRPLIENTSLFTQHRIPSIFCEIGANLPLPQPIHENVYFNSFNLWQATYGMGKYIAHQGHKKVMYLSHYYDGGYHTPYAFCKGLTGNGSDYTMPFGIQDGYDDQQLKRLEEHLQQNQPDALYLIYSNPRHYNLLEWLTTSEFAGIPVYACPYWIDDDLLENHFNKATLGVHSANSWSRNMKNGQNQTLVKEYEEEEEITTSVFVAMGFEAGNLLAQAYRALGDKWYKRKSFRSFMLEATLEGPREGHHFHKELQCSFSKHHLRQIQKTVNGLENKVIQDLDTSQSLSIMDELYQYPNSGWDNPYLCV
ncbi:MAG: ABC transporter substrate-binding protein [Chitinophagales bacterium]